MADQPAAHEPRVEAPLPRAGDHDGLAQWIDARYAGRVILSTRACRSWKKAANFPYNDPGRIVEVLDLIAGPYRDQLIGVLGANSALRERADALRVKTGPAVTASGAGEAPGGHYEFTYEGARLDLHHVRDLGTSFDPRYYLAVYFGVDDAGRVILADLPRHLPTAADHT